MGWHFGVVGNDDCEVLDKVLFLLSLIVEVDEHVDDYLVHSAGQSASVIGQVLQNFEQFVQQRDEL